MSNIEVINFASATDARKIKQKLLSRGLANKLLGSSPRICIGLSPQGKARKVGTNWEGSQAACIRDFMLEAMVPEELKDVGRISTCLLVEAPGTKRPIHRDMSAKVHEPTDIRSIMSISPQEILADIYGQRPELSDP